MADPGFNHSILYYPRGVAVHRLPLGLPRGAAREVCSVHMSRMSRPQRSQSTQSVFVEKGAVVKTLFFSARLLEPLPGVVPQKPVERAFKEQIEKYAPVLESYQLHRAAQYLRMLCDGALALEPLLKVSARAWPVFGKICPQKCVFSWPGVRSFLGPISRTRGRRRSITRHSSLPQTRSSYSRRSGRVGCRRALLQKLRLSAEKGEGNTVKQDKFVLQSAAVSWAAGVPWDEALRIARKAVPQAKPKAKARQPRQVLLAE